MRDAMLRAGLVCSALFAVALLVSGCAGGSISEAEQQSLAAAVDEHVDGAQMLHDRSRECTRDASAG